MGEDLGLDISINDFARWPILENFYLVCRYIRNISVIYADGFGQVPTGTMYLEYFDKLVSLSSLCRPP
jgi:hypothetical protein